MGDDKTRKKKKQQGRPAVRSELTSNCWSELVHNSVHNDWNIPSSGADGGAGELVNSTCFLFSAAPDATRESPEEIKKRAMKKAQRIK